MLARGGGRRMSATSYVATSPVYIAANTVYLYYSSLGFMVFKLNIAITDPSNLKVVLRAPSSGRSGPRSTR